MFRWLFLVLLGTIMTGWLLTSKTSQVGHGQGSGSQPFRPDLKRWVEADLISSDQAALIESFEEKRSPKRRISLFSEALGYIGAVLALAGGGVALGQVWEDLAAAARVGSLAVAALLAVAGGWLLRSHTEAALKRFMSVLWALSVALATGAIGTFFVDVVALDEEMRPLLIGGTGAIYAAALWRSQPTPLQLTAMLVTGLVAAVGLVTAVKGSPEWLYGQTIWVYGVASLALARRDLLRPAWTATLLGAILAAYGPSVGAHAYGWQLGIGLATGIALMGFGVTGRRLPLLGIGSLAALGYVTALVVRYFGNAIGIPTALAGVGILVIALAIVMGRGGRFRGGWLERPEAET